MGTRASFFIHDPRDINQREWLGCIAWDGYPHTNTGLWKYFKRTRTSSGFKKAVMRIAKDREDFSYPDQHRFPFPWKNDLFLTDYTYAFFDNEIQITCFHRGFVSLTKYVNDEKFREEYDDPYARDTLSSRVPAPIGGDTPGPDSIIILAVR